MTVINQLLRPGADQSSKAAFGKSAFAKTSFILLKIRLAHINRAKSKNAFEHILARSSRKHFARYTCQNVLESTFGFCSIGVTSHIFNKRKHVRACFSKHAFAKSSFVRLACARPYVNTDEYELYVEEMPRIGNLDERH